jgi:LacI family transcriptional regulator
MESKRITIQDIAARANVSKSTVSRVLNNTTPVHEAKKKAVMEAVELLNFQPNSLASGLAGGQSMTIGVQTQKIGSPFYDSITHGIIQSLSSSRYSPMFVDGRWEPELERAGIETLLRRQVDGLIITGGQLPKEQIEIVMNQTPVLIVGREIKGLEEHCLFIDNFDAAYRATKYLIELGHRNILHISGVNRQQDAIRRYKGYQYALEEAGIEFDPELVYEGSFDAPSGVDAVETLLDKGKEFTAIFSANDMMAFGARLALHHRGIAVPKDVSLIGFDDQPEAAFMTPPLTTVRQPAFEMGIAVGEAMLCILKNEPYSLPNLPCEIQIRESTARIG